MTEAERGAVFLDRDGVLNEDLGYVHRPADLRWIDGARDAVARINRAGLLAIVVTNQSGVGRGYFTHEAVEQIHAHLDEYFGKSGVRFDRYYVCPHHPEDNCDCRKPKPKFLHDAAREYGLDLPRCFMIGDRTSDIQAGVNAGVPTILVLTGVGRETLAKQEVNPDHVAEDIGAAAAWILEHQA